MIKFLKKNLEKLKYEIIYKKEEYEGEAHRK